VFTSHPVSDDPNNSLNAEIYVMNPDGTGRHQLTFNQYEERAPSWSPDGTQIAFCARIGGNDFEICVMNADGRGFQQLTSNTVPDLTPSWSPDGTQIAFQQGPVGRPQIFIMNSELDPDGTLPKAHPLEDPLPLGRNQAPPVGRGQDARRIGSQRWCRRDLLRRISGG
jgi:Tol biopolymer transport system component